MRSDLDLKQYCKDLEAENNELLKSNLVHKVISFGCLAVLSVVLFCYFDKPKVAETKPNIEFIDTLNINCNE